MAQVGGWELDLSTKEVLMTEEVCRIHGVEPGYKLKLEEAMNFYAPESKPALEEVLKKATESGEPYDLESLFIPSGSKDKIWVRSLGKAVYSGGKIVKLAGTFQNIDKYKREEGELRESEARYRSVLQSATDAIVTADSNGFIIGWNSGAERIFGYSYTEAVGQSLTSIISLYHLDEHTNGMKGLQFGGDRHVIGKTVELEGLRKDKSVFPIELSLYDMGNQIRTIFYLYHPRHHQAQAGGRSIEKKRREAQRIV